jgi:hypothetical protein
MRGATFVGFLLAAATAVTACTSAAASPPAGTGGTLASSEPTAFIEESAEPLASWSAYSIAPDAATPAAATTGAGTTAASTIAPTVTVTVAPTAAVKTAGPTVAAQTTPPTKAIATPTPAPALPNLFSMGATTTPAAPVCNHAFVIDIEVANKAFGAMPGEALMVVSLTRNSDGWIGVKYVVTIPALPAMSAVHLRKTVNVVRTGVFDARVEVDSSLWLTETNETDNITHTTIPVSMGTCGKI